MPLTGNNQWQSYTAKLPAFRIKAGKVNQIVVSDTANPPGHAIWGVRNARITKTTTPTPTVTPTATSQPTATPTPTQTGDIPLPANAAYGNIPGGDQTHVDQVVYTFTLPNSLAKINQPLDVWQFHLDIYDVDWAGEVALYINGHLFYIVPPSGNNQWKTYDVTLPGAFLTTQTNRIIVSDTANPPGQAIWGVRNASISKFGVIPTATPTPAVADIPLPATPAYGNIPGGDQVHVNQVVYTFTGSQDRQAFSFEAYDVDWQGEVALYINSHLFYIVPPTGNNQWATYTVNLPMARLLPGKTNRITVSDTVNPPNHVIWGVRNAKVGSATAILLPSMPAYGNIPGGDQTHVNQVDYTFGGLTGQVMLTFQAYDVDWAGEIAVRLNNRLVYVVPVHNSRLKRLSGIERQAVSHLAPQENNAWTTYVVHLRDAWVNDNTNNELVFDETVNPPGQAIWGVRGVIVTKIVTP